MSSCVMNTIKIPVSLILWALGPLQVWFREGIHPGFQRAPAGRRWRCPRRWLSSQLDLETCSGLHSGMETCWSGPASAWTVPLVSIQHSSHLITHKELISSWFVRHCSYRICLHGIKLMMRPCGVFIQAHRGSRWIHQLRRWKRFMWRLVSVWSGWSPRISRWINTPHV